MLNWLFRKTQTDDVYKLDILSPEADLAHLYTKLAIFYHYTLYSKLVDILACVYGGYNGEVFKYIPPSDHLDDLYIRVLSAFNRLDKRSELIDSKIVDFKAFPNLFNNHHEQTILFEKLLKDFSEDKEMLKGKLIQQYPLSNDVQVAFNDIDRLIQKHTKLKSESINGTGLIEYNELSLNLNSGTLEYKDKVSVKINPLNKEIKLLQLLLLQKNNIVTYFEIAKYLDLNSFHGEVTEDVITAVKTLKIKLNKLLIKAGFNKDVIDNVKNSGYRLNSIKLI